MENNYGLLIASIVAIVAIVGLVILFSANTGASVAHVNPSCYVQVGNGQWAWMEGDMCPETHQPFFGHKAANYGD